MKQEKRPITLNQLSAAEKAALMRELEAEQQQEKQRITKERQTYKQLVDQEVHRCYPLLVAVSKQLSLVKEEVFNNLTALIKTKAELYDRENDQQRDAFTTDDGTITIEIGYNVRDNYDDTVNVGIGKINDFISSLANDAKTKLLTDSILKLLSKDSKGNLKASRVMQLKQIADKSGDKGFIEAIDIIQQAYKPIRTQEFIRCLFKGKDGNKTILPLGMTEAPFSNKHPLAEG